MPIGWLSLWNTLPSHFCQALSSIKAPHAQGTWTPPPSPLSFGLRHTLEHLLLSGLCGAPFFLVLSPVPSTGLYVLQDQGDVSLSLASPSLLVWPRETPRHTDTPVGFPGSL